MRGRWTRNEMPTGHRPKSEREKRKRNPKENGEIKTSHRTRKIENKRTGHVPSLWPHWPPFTGLFFFTYRVLSVREASSGSAGRVLELRLLVVFTALLLFFYRVSRFDGPRRVLEFLSSLTKKWSHLEHTKGPRHWNDFESRSTWDRSGFFFWFLSLSLSLSIFIHFGFVTSYWGPSWNGRVPHSNGDVVVRLTEFYRVLRTGPATT